MTDTIQVTRHVFMINSTKREIRRVPFIYTAPSNNPDQIGFFEGMAASVNAIRVGWDNLTGYGWNATDRMEFVKDTDCDLTEYQGRGFTVV